MLDLSVPRNIDAEVSHLPGIEVVNIEQLKDIKNESLGLREQSVPKTKQIIHEHILQYYSWLHTVPAFSIIEQLERHFKYTDVNKMVSMLVKQGVITQADSKLSNDKILGMYLKYVKQNYYKKEFQDWIISASSIR